MNTPRTVFADEAARLLSYPNGQALADYAKANGITPDGHRAGTLLVSRGGRAITEWLPNKPQGPLWAACKTAYEWSRDDFLRNDDLIWEAPCTQ